MDAFHREGLICPIGFLREEEQDGWVDRAAEDSDVHTLLLYDLVPSDPLIQAQTALEGVRPHIHSDGGNIEVQDVVDGVVHLRLSSSCHGCPGSEVTLERGIVAALREGFPDFKGIQVHKPAPTPMTSLIPLDQIRPLRHPVFREVTRLEEVPAGTRKGFDVDGVRAGGQHGRRDL